MKLTIESTEALVDLNGVRCRVWQGTTEDGAPLLVLVHRIAVDATHVPDQVARELVEQHAPHVAVVEGTLELVHQLDPRHLD